MVKDIGTIYKHQYMLYEYIVQYMTSVPKYINSAPAVLMIVGLSKCVTRFLSTSLAKNGYCIRATSPKLAE
jgi:predicted MFS family arabinose efflux permease